jgi:hypothetical protein
MNTTFSPAQLSVADSHKLQTLFDCYSKLDNYESLESALRDNNWELAGESTSLDYDEIVIETDPEDVVIMGYADLGDRLSIYGG